MKFTKRVKVCFLFFYLLLTGIGCDERWKTMNSNPNTTTSLPDGFLFSSAVRGAFLDGRNLIQAFFGGQYAHMVIVDYSGREIDKYLDIYPEDFSESIFNSVYNGGIRNIVEVLEATSTGETKNEVRNAQAKVIAAVNFIKLTDLFGDIPYTEAARGKSGNFSPVYDTQEEIYGHIVAELMQARTVLYSATEEQIYPAEFDPLYSGKLEPWKLFTNSFLFRLAMRARHADAGKYNAIIEECLSLPLVEENIDNANLTMFDVEDSNLYNPWYSTVIEYRGNKYPILWSEYFVETLKELNDPRLAFFAQPNDEGEIIGFPNGLIDTPDYGSWLDRVDDLAKFSPEFASRNQPLNLLTAAEIWLLRAEAEIYNKGGNSNATVFFRTGITRALEQWNLPIEAIQTYLSSQSVTSLSGTIDEKQKQISTQLWIAYIPNFVESWNTIRRTGHPKIAQRTALNYSKGVTNGLLPKRLIYPATIELISNGENLQKAIEKMGGEDKIDMPVWWDVVD